MHLNRLIAMKTKNLRIACLAVTLISSFAAVLPVAGGVIFPVSQSRFLAASVNLNAGDPPSLTNYASASSLGTYRRTNTLSGFYRPKYPYLEQAGQNSVIGTSTITATGMVDNEPGIYQDGFANSDFKVTFRLTASADYSLTGSLVWTETTSYSSGSAAPFVRLTGASGLIFEAPAPAPDGLPVDYALAGNLPAGEYTLEAHANSTVPFGYDQSLMNYEVAFSAVPVAPPQYAGQVYLLSGTLNALIQNGNTNSPVVIATHDLVNAALGSSLFSTVVPSRQTLVMVSDNINHGVRLAVWDKVSSNLVAEIGPIQFQSGVASGTNFTAVADASVANVGRIVDSSGAVKSRLTMVANGSVDAGGTLVSLSVTPIIGQLDFIDDLGQTNLILIKGGSLKSGRQLGTSP